MQTCSCSWSCSNIFVLISSVLTLHIQLEQPRFARQQMALFDGCSRSIFRAVLPLHATGGGWYILTGGKFGSGCMWMAP